jgi:hypothetical protein
MTPGDITFSKFYTKRVLVFLGGCGGKSLDAWFFDLTEMTVVRDAICDNERTGRRMTNAGLGFVTALAALEDGEPDDED